MSAGAWTPGPWAYSEELRANFSMVSGAERVVAGIPNDADPDGLAEQRANAHLIASAPDLYAALEALVTRRDRAVRETGGFVAADGSDGRYARARAALARARGES